MSPKYVSNGGIWTEVKVTKEEIKKVISPEVETKDEVETKVDAEIEVIKAIEKECEVEVEEPKKIETVDLDITGDGKVDSDDYSLAGKVLSSKKSSSSKKKKTTKSKS